MYLERGCLALRVWVVLWLLLWLRDAGNGFDFIHLREVYSAVERSMKMEALWLRFLNS
jgi:hypothetical protein